jgi:hypothetical protein
MLVDEDAQDVASAILLGTDLLDRMVNELRTSKSQVVAFDWNDHGVGGDKGVGGEKAEVRGG